MARSAGSGNGAFGVAAVCDPRLVAAEAAAEVAEQLLGSRPAVFSDHQELIASGAVEALDVVTDPWTHHAIAVPALDTGLHVICEKPLGITVRAARSMVEAAAESGSCAGHRGELSARRAPIVSHARCSSRNCSAIFTS